ncbi:MAG: ABC transporter permease [Lactobacillaceae bacterium]|jgi:ABC-2 type transport system permease protein|nr:ABC transporter permease [Lactobacillaceae bacterium]
MADVFSLYRVFAIGRKEFLQLKRDKITLAMIIGLPIVLLTLFGYAINTDPKNLNSAVLSRDNTEFTRSVITGLKNSGYFKIEKEITTDKEGKELLQSGKMQFVITIPDNFSRNLIRGDKPSILIEIDATDPVTIAGAASSLQGIIKSIIIRDLKGPVAHLRGELPAFDIEVQKLYNPEGLTHYNIVPGLIALILMITCIIMTALALTKERERGNMENLLSMPVQPIEVMMGKISPYIIIGYIQSIIILLMAKFLFHVPVLGSVALLMLLTLIFIICNLALGFAISTAAKNQTQALQMSMMTMIPSILLSGFAFPFYGMPLWAQGVGGCLPMTYFIRITRGIILKGNSFIEVWPHVWPLLIFMLVVTTFTVRIYKRTLD